MNANLISVPPIAFRSGRTIPRQPAGGGASAPTDGTTICVAIAKGHAALSAIFCNKKFGGIALLLALAVSLGHAAKPPMRPNILYILLDDARWDEFGAVGH